MTQRSQHITIYLQTRNSLSDMFHIGVHGFEVVLCDESVEELDPFEVGGDLL
jgi:hypothetical protein